MWVRKTCPRVSPQRKTLLTARKNDTNREMVAGSDDGDGWRLVLARGSHSPPPVRKRQTTLALRTVGPRPRIEDGLSGSRWIYNITIIFSYNMSSYVGRPGNFLFLLFFFFYWFDFFLYGIVFFCDEMWGCVTVNYVFVCCCLL